MFKKVFFLITALQLSASTFAKMPNQLKDNNIIASKLYNYISFYLNLEPSKREIIVEVLNNQNLNYSQKISTIQDNKDINAEFKNLEMLRNDLTKEIGNVSLTNEDLTIISIEATFEILETRANISTDCDIYKTAVNICTRTMLDDYTENFYNHGNFF